MPRDADAPPPVPEPALALWLVEQAAERGKVMPHGRATFQVVALLVR